MHGHSHISRRSSRRAARGIRRRVRKAGLVVLALAAGTGAAMGLPPLVRGLGRPTQTARGDHGEAMLSDLAAAYIARQGAEESELEDARPMAREPSARDR